MKHSLVFLVVFCLLVLPVFSDDTPEYPKAKVNMEDYVGLVNLVHEHRKERLVGLEKFLEMSQEENVVIIDTRSKFRFDRIHIKGAVHLNFSDFTVANLQALIPSPDPTVLIYCNNNFDENQIDFTSKIAPMPMELTRIPSGPTLDDMRAQIRMQERLLMLALNVPTFINLYGYGYRNVYELDELVDVSDPGSVSKGRSCRSATRRFFRIPPAVLPHTVSDTSVSSARGGI